jgi:hypothetical protein
MDSEATMKRYSVISIAFVRGLRDGCHQGIGNHGDTA